MNHQFSEFLFDMYYFEIVNRHQQDRQGADNMFKQVSAPRLAGVGRRK
jgi:hypothetical protein